MFKAMLESQSYESVHSPRNSLARTPPGIVRPQPVDKTSMRDSDMEMNRSSQTSANESESGLKRKRQNQSMIEVEDNKDDKNVNSPPSGDTSLKKKKKRKTNSRKTSTSDEYSELSEIEDNKTSSEGHILQKEPTSALAVSLLECVKEIEKVRLTSGNLKGSYQKILKLTEGTIKSVCTEMANRIVNSPTKEIQALEKENYQLKKQIHDLQKRIGVMEKANPKPVADENIHTTTTNSHLTTNKVISDQLFPYISKEIANLGNSLKETMQNKITNLKEELFNAMITSSNAKTELSLAKDRSASKDYVIPIHPTTSKVDNINRPAIANNPPKRFQTKNLDKPNGSARKKKPAKGLSLVNTDTGFTTPVPNNIVPPTTVKRKTQRTRNSAAVVINKQEDCTLGYDEIIKEGKLKINISELGITDIRPRYSMTGGMILEIPGNEADDKATSLAEKMNTLFTGKGVRISCPRKMKEIIISGLDVSVNTEEITDAISSVTNSKEDIRIGKIHKNNRGAATVWVKCSEKIAVKLINMGRISIGWSKAKVIETEKRPIQCYRCWEFGHVRDNCNNKDKTDRSTWCYICGASNHSIQACQAPSPECCLCKERGFPANYRMGNKLCKTVEIYKNKQLKGKEKEIPDRRTNIRTQKESRVESATKSRKTTGDQPSANEVVVGSGDPTVDKIDTEIEIE
ncbi:uncharacterized protein LOC108628091 [Ceratina calcarata]|uniref:Uncharacterized protein LOC108628091 n=1 Tax=Ceratina calcarata TaxID=156304 RepID=A0AAJ7J6K5_9HYME|nr:uncharacterized protein LOC108628091 [Ceratina calcarata]